MVADIPASTAAPRDRSREAGKGARLKRAQRETRIIGWLNRGVSMTEIAAREGVTLNRMRKVVRGILAARTPQSPAEYVAVQVGRLNEALAISYDEMYNADTGVNFNAIDSVVRIVREIDRWRGFAPAALVDQAEPRRLPARANRSARARSEGRITGSRIGNGAASD